MGRGVGDAAPPTTEMGETGGLSPLAMNGGDDCAGGLPLGGPARKKLGKPPESEDDMDGLCCCGGDCEGLDHRLSEDDRV